MQAGPTEATPAPMEPIITADDSLPTAPRPGATASFCSFLSGRMTALVEFSLGVRLLEYLLLAPLSAFALRLFLDRWGRVSVGNFEIARFLLSPQGVGALVVLGAVALAALYLELAGLMRLMGNRHLAWWRALAELGPRFPRLVELGLRQVVAYLLLALPFLATIGLIYWVCWARHDIYALLVLKPPAFWIGASLAAGVAAIYAVLAARLALRWLFALPILLFEPGTVAVAALHRSGVLAKGRLLSLAVPVAAWGALLFGLSSLTLAGLVAASDAILDRAGSSLALALPTTAALLALHGAVAVALSMAGTLSFAALVLALYERAIGRPLPSPVAVAAPHRARSGRLAIIVVLLVMLSTWAGLRLLLDAEVRESVEITAHRAKSGGAPENTVAALRGAIEVGADWAEIDVQHSSDGAIVVIHDTDLVRIGGPRRLVSRSTLAEIQSIDVGRALAPEFAGERVPTLEQMIEAAGDRIRLNIELKPHGPRDVEPLVRHVVEVIVAAGIAERCRICSQSYDGLRLARRLEPRLQVGFIAGAAIGDLARLDVDFLMVNFPMATRDLVQSAALRGLPVHAWTVDDPAWLSRLIDRGVANVITDRPEAMRARLDEIRALDPIERVLLLARNILSD